MILIPNKTKALFVNRSRTVSPPHGDLLFSIFFIRASLNLDILDVKCDCKLTFETVCVVLFPESLREFVF